MKRVVVLILVVVLSLVAIGCATHVHTVGNGPKTGQMMQARQWYALWGLVPLNEVNTNTMAGGAADYEIMTQASALDVIINIFTTYVTVTSRTVTVTK